MRGRFVGRAGVRCRSSAFLYPAHLLDVNECILKSHGLRSRNYRCIPAFVEATANSLPTMLGELVTALQIVAGKLSACSK